MQAMITITIERSFPEGARPLSVELVRDANGRWYERRTQDNFIEVASNDDELAKSSDQWVDWIGEVLPIGVGYAPDDDPNA